MMYFANINSHNVLIRIGQSLLTSDEYGSSDVLNLEVDESIYNNARTYGDNYYIYQDGEIVLNPNYEEEQEAKRQEEYNQLTLTKADFWIALLDRNITKNMVKEKINLIPDETLKAKTLIRLDDADHFWRGDPSMNIVGAMFGLTSEDLNYLFKNGALPKNEVNI